jgi:hypothetical protein
MPQNFDGRIYESRIKDILTKTFEGVKYTSQKINSNFISSLKEMNGFRLMIQQVFHQFAFLTTGNLSKLKDG